MPRVDIASRLAGGMLGLEIAQRARDERSEVVAAVHPTASLSGAAVAISTLPSQAHLEAIPWRLRPLLPEDEPDLRRPH